MISDPQQERVVSKDDLINAIWNGRSVSDAALTTRLNVARGPLGDSGEEQRLIKTLPRKGFRFTGPVQEVGTTTAPAISSAPVDVSQAALALWDKPSIAVLPFQNLGGDPEQEYFADGMTEDITALLSQTRDFLVIARGSTLAYKTKSADIDDIGRQLGVRYVLQGSVRTAGNKLRVNAQLVEKNGDQGVGGPLRRRAFRPVRGAGRYHQRNSWSPLSAAVVRRSAVAPASTAEQPGCLGPCRTRHDALVSLTKENLDTAADLASRAIEIAPDYGLAYGLRAFALGYRAYTQWGEDWYGDAKRSSADISHTLGLQGDDPTALFLIGGASHFMARHRASIGLLERAIELNPNLAMAHGLLAISYASIDRPAVGLVHVEKAMRLSPRDPMTYLFYAAQALCKFVSGDLSGAICSAERGISINPSSCDNHFYMAAALAELNELDKANKQIKRGPRFVPKASLLVIGRAIEGRNSGWARYHAALRKAGLGNEVVAKSK